jgi:tetratricopeptide (TPR) repeat protein
VSDHPSHDALSAFLRGELSPEGRRGRKMDAIERVESQLALSWSMRYEDPSLMAQFAMLAVRSARDLTPRRHGAERVFDLQGRAHAELGNAYRVLAQHDLAEENLGRARHLLELGSRDESLQVRLLELEASLEADRRQFSLAANLLLQVSGFYQRTGDRHLAGRTLIKRGLYVGYAGRPEEALRLLEESLALVDGEREPGLVYAARHNQLLFIIDCGRFREAQAFRTRHRWVLGRDEGRMSRIRLRELDGRVEAGLGNPGRAEAAFREAKEAFEERGLPYDASIVALDLAAALLAQGRAAEAGEVVGAATQAFHALRIEREALAAVVVLRSALRMGQATAALAEDVAAFLRRRRNDPTARFEIRPL